MSALVAQNVSFVYSAKGAESVQALKDVNLSVEEKQFVVAIGASGCGKTTLLNLFAGFLKPTEGEIYYTSSPDEKFPVKGPGGESSVVYGEEEDKKSTTEKNMRYAHQPIVGPGSDRGVVFQKHALLPWLSVIDNVTFGLKLQGVGRQERRNIAMKYLSLVGLKDFLDHKIYHLSGGMQQRVGIARALTSDPSTLLMDEPLGALDALTRENTQELILKVWKTTGKKVFFITHSVEEALFMATKLIVMSPRPGRITHTFDLDFCQQYLDIEDARKIKSDVKFIQMREKILQIVYDDEKSA